MRPLFRKLHWLARRSRKEAELQEELEFHLSEEAEEQAAGGLAAAEAHLAARRDLGNAARVAEETRAVWGWSLAEQLLQDVRYGLRTMSANRAFSALAIVTLASGIGANTAIFSFLDAILLRSLPVFHPESLVTLSWHTNGPEVHGINRHDDRFLERGQGFGDSIFSWSAFEMFRRNASIFETVFGFQGAGNLHLAIGNEAEIDDTEYVTGDYFQGLGVPPAAGRLIMPDDDRAGASPVAVISYGLSQRRYGSAVHAVGQKILVNQVPFTIAGVVAPEFFGTDPGMRPEVYIPIHANLLLERGGPAFYADPNIEWVVAMGRLRPGVSRAQAQAVLGPQFSDWMRTENTVRSRSDLPTLVVRDGSAGLNGVRQQYSKALVILLVVVALILALACTNIANLLLARATARRREIAVRLSIGAGRWRIVRQLLTESVLLASFGGLLGLVLGVWGIRLLTMLLANGREDFKIHAGLNWHVLLVVSGLSILTGTMFGLAPALQATRTDLLTGIKGLPSASVRPHRLRRITLSRAFVVVQITISLLILVGAGLFAKSLSRLESIQLGFNRESVLTFRLDAKQAGHRAAEAPVFYNSLLTRFSNVPGVRSASLSWLALLDGRIFTMVGAGGDEPKKTAMWGVAPKFFTTMGIPILLGREIQPSDMRGSHLGAVVSQEFARERFGGRNPVGQFISIPADCPKCVIEIVGVSGDVAIGNNVKDERWPVVFIPFTIEAGLEGMTFELRTAGDPRSYAGVVRELVHEADPHLPVTEIRTESALVDGTMNREVVFARLCSAFALLALAIACVGLYGTMSYNVARRTSEIGIRMALGAPRGGVVWMVFRELTGLAAIGLAVGLPAAICAAKLVKSFLFETKADDPAALGLAAASLISAVFAAGFVPARKATRVDPAVALRHE